MVEEKSFASLSSGLLARKGTAKPAMRRQGFSSPSALAEAQDDDLGWNDMGYDVNPTDEAPAAQDTEQQQAEPPAAEQDGLTKLQSSLMNQPSRSGTAPATPLVKKQQDQLAAQIEASSTGEEEADTDASEKSADQPYKETAAEQADKEQDGEEPVFAPLVLKTQMPEAAQGQATQSQATADLEEPAISPETAEAVSQNIAETVPEKQDVKVPAVKTKVRKVASTQTRKAQKKAAFTLRLDRERHLRLRLATAVKNISAQQLVTKAVDEYLRKMPELDALADRVPASKNT